MKEYIEINDKKFKFVEKENAYGIAIDVEDKKAIVIVSLTYCKDNLEDALEKASKCIDNLDINKLKNTIVDNLYQEEDDWYGVDENGNSIKYTKEEYISKLQLKTISVDNIYAEYWFDDNDMYGGHDILITQKHDENTYNVELAG